jgi:hypothetical protein
MPIRKTISSLVSFPPLPSLLALAALFAACAPVSNPDMLKEIEGFDLPGAKDNQPGMAAVYVSRPSSVGGLVRFNVFAENADIDSLEAGYNKAGQHIWFSINPGRHRLLSVAENVAEVELDFKADSTYFFRQDPGPGFLMARNDLVTTDSVEGKYLVKTTKPGTMLRGRLVVDEKLRLEAHPMSGRGLRAYADIRFGGMTGGLQAESGLESEKGDEAKINKGGFGIALRYYFIDRVALHFGTGALWGSATAPGTKAMDYTKQWSTDVGLVVVPWQKAIGMGLMQLGMAGGLQYTRLALAQEFVDFVEAGNPDFAFYDDAATGMGWYVGPEFEVVARRGFVFHIDGRFVQEYPEFPKGTKAFSGSELLFGAGIGYRF